jgi:hypothetical protein
MKLYNRGQRTVTSKSGKLAPDKWLEVSEAEGAMLLKMYPREIVSTLSGNSGFVAEIDRLTAENAALKAQLASLKAEDASLKAEFAPDLVAELAPAPAPKSKAKR